MRTLCYAVLSFFLLQTAVFAQCLHPYSLVHSVVAVEGEGLARAGKKIIPWHRIPVLGSGWYRTPHDLVTNAHVVQRMQLSSTWQRSRFFQDYAKEIAVHMFEEHVRVAEFAGRPVALGEIFDRRYTPASDHAVLEFARSPPSAAIRSALLVTRAARGL
jgi:hypothetical protein